MAVIKSPTALTPEQIAQQKAQGGTPLQTIGTAAPAGQGPTGGAPAAPQAQGSGRFTNLQKYLQANQGGGQRIAGQIGSNMQKQFGEQSKQASDYYGKLGQSVEQAKGVASAGAGYQNQLQGIGTQISNATITPEQLADQKLAQARLAQRDQQDLSQLEAFTNQPDFNKFQDIQAGRGIDENLLALQQQRAAQSAQQALQGSQAAQQALGTESGRFDLLRKSFGGDARNSYNQGQQRLDQVLLGQGGGLNQLQANAARQAVANAQQAKLAVNQQSEVNRLAAQERGLIGDINTQAGANEAAYMSMLDSYVNPFNTQRDADYADLDRAVQTYRPGAEGQQKAWEAGFTDDQMARLGLTDSNQGVYNVFNGDTLTSAKDIAKKGMSASTGEQIANQADVNRYNALSKIMGTNAPKKITGVGDIGQTASWTNAEGDSALKSRLDVAQKQWDDAAGKTKYVGYDPSMSGSRAGGAGYGSVNPGRAYVNEATLADMINQGRAGIKNTDATNTYLNQDMAAIGEAEARARAMGMDPSTSSSQFLGGREWLQHQNGPRYGQAYGQQEWRNNVSNVLQPKIIKMLQDEIKKQNYNRTLGGRRNTFLDTEAAAKTAGVKLDNTPITGQDPSMVKKK